MVKDKKILISVDSEMQEKIELFSEHLNVTKSEFIRRAISVFMVGKKNRVKKLEKDIRSRLYEEIKAEVIADLIKKMEV